MPLEDLVNAGVDIGNASAVNAAINSEQSVTAAQDTNVRVEPEPFIEEEEEAGVEAEAASTTEEPAVDPDMPPVPTGSEAEEPPAAAAEAAPAAVAPNAEKVASDERVAELQKQLADEKARNAKLSETAGAAARSEEGKARDAELKELIEDLGENHPIVKVTKRQFAEMDRNEAERAANKEADVKAQENKIAADNQAAHDKHVQAVPFLGSFYKDNDEPMIAMAAAISLQVQDDPKLHGTEASKPFTAGHYREIEARLLKRFPEAIAKFYPKAVRTTNKPGNKVVSISQVRGGHTPPASQTKKVTREDVYNAAASNPSIDLDQLMDNLSRAG
jgi:hypothetical protein